MSSERAGVIVFGASGGVGAPICARFESDGLDVTRIIHTMSTESQLPSSNPPLVCDVRSLEAVKEIVAKLSMDSGPISILDLSGLSFANYLYKSDSSTVQRIVDTNIVGPLNLAVAALSYLPPTSKLILTSSVTVKRPTAGAIPYIASKGAVEALVEALPHEASRRGISIYGIRLGYMEAGMGLQVPDTVRSNVEAYTPERRFGDIESLYGLVRFLVTAAPQYMTGSIIDFAGGA